MEMTKFCICKLPPRLVILQMYPDGNVDLSTPKIGPQSVPMLNVLTFFNSRTPGIQH